MKVFAAFRHSVGYSLVKVFLAGRNHELHESSPNFLDVALRGVDALSTGQGLFQLIIDNGEWIIVFSVG